MTPLILGASGQVGQALIAEFDKRGWTWTGTYHEHQVDKRLLKADLGNITATSAMVRALKPKMVFMPSGFTWVDGCEDQSDRAYAVNAFAPEAVAQVCHEIGATVVFYSTEYVFGENGGPYGEEAPTDPLGVYAQSKLEGEQRVLAACPEALVLRTTVVYGPEPQGKNGVYQVIRNLSAGSAMSVPKDQLTSPTYNTDLARASVELAELKEKGIWNVAGPQVVDRATFAQLAAITFGLNTDLLHVVETNSMRQKARRPLSAGLKIDKLVARLGWTPMGPEAGLKAMHAALKTNGQWAKLMALD